eukprot:gene15211-biopygen5403
MPQLPQHAREGTGYQRVLRTPQFHKNARGHVRYQHPATGSCDSCREVPAGLSRRSAALWVFPAAAMAPRAPPAHNGTERSGAERSGAERKGRPAAPLSSPLLLRRAWANGGTGNADVPVRKRLRPIRKHTECQRSRRECRRSRDVRQRRRTHGSAQSRQEASTIRQVSEVPMGLTPHSSEARPVSWGFHVPPGLTPQSSEARPVS